MKTQILLCLTPLTSYFLHFFEMFGISFRKRSILVFPTWCTYDDGYCFFLYVFSVVRENSPPVFWFLSAIMTDHRMFVDSSVTQSWIKLAVCQIGCGAQKYSETFLKLCKNHAQFSPEQAESSDDTKSTTSSINWSSPPNWRATTRV